MLDAVRQHHGADPRHCWLQAGSGANPNGGDAHASSASRSLNTGTVRKDSVTTGRPAGPKGTSTVAPGNRLRFDVAA